ncbi:ATP-binding protein [Streptomyces sp. ISL-11]|uniref:ATP-binding protein n=1 Tax=Streptomyces sp. ISL-11 TaxID=2819174 RepID=UPI001BED3896|nr:ATP-binding protein [Streptomyces sp. ISL-11]MBT2386597.1 ATP-binding protein [Streptomyces sp. ISL-11]
MNAEPGHRYVLHTEADPVRMPQVRRIVAAHLRYWQLQSLVRPVGLGVEELLTNVHRHAGADKTCTLELAWSGRHLTVSVTDRDPRLPPLCAVVPCAAPGRGLAMIAALSDSWGTRPAPGGKVVWFTVRAQDPAGPLPRPLTPRPGPAGLALVPAR